MSLKKKLIDIIELYDGRICPLSVIYEICKKFGYKQSNAERRLREVDSINPVKNEKGFIVGYRWKKTEKNGQLILL